MWDQIDLKLTTEWAKIVGGVIVFAIGFYQYRHGQKWKRREFVASQIKDFEADPKIRLAMTMLDWNDRVLYFPAEGGTKFISIRVNEPLLRSALLPHEDANGYFKNEVIIRECFDDFLDMLVRLSAFVEAKLIRTEELRPYLEYWITLISGKKPDWHTPEFFVLLRNHIQIYGFTKINQLMEHFGYDPVPSPEEVRHAVQSTLAIRPLGAEKTIPESDQHV